MMGPLAGIGDTLFHVIPSTIIGSIASYMALEGSPLALVLWIFFGLLRMFCMKNFFSLGYREGAKIVSEIGNRLKKITKAANILGITVIGALIPSVVNARFAYEFSWGEVSISVQELADQDHAVPGPHPGGVLRLLDAGKKENELDQSHTAAGGGWHSGLQPESICLTFIERRRKHNERIRTHSD